MISQDDKARVPLGITAANKHRPILMHMEYRHSLPDHSNHTNHTNLVTYSGPTYVAIRSGKHSSSTAASHALDFNTLLSLPEFEDLTKGK